MKLGVEENSLLADNPETMSRRFTFLPTMTYGDFILGDFGQEDKKVLQPNPTESTGT